MFTIGDSHPEDSTVSVTGVNVKERSSNGLPLPTYPGPPLGLNKAPTGLPGSDTNPLWLTFTELARRIPGVIVEDEGSVIGGGVDEALEGMYRAIEPPETNGTPAHQ